MEKNKEIINDMRELWSQTHRPCVNKLEQILYKPFKVLDHGFVRVVDYMGDDAAVVQAARVSYGRGTKKVSEDQGLINYLMRHRHSTPFEMCEIKLHVKLPIFVARQWIRHRTASVNEYSARYSVLDKEFYIPAPEHLAAQSKNNRQGREEVITGERADEILRILKQDAFNSYENYQNLLNEDEEGNVRAEGVQPLARELARMNLPVNFYTQWYWKIDLNNFMHFLSLRADPHSQYEIRAYANIMLDILRVWVPVTYQAFLDYRYNSASLSGKALSVVKKMIRGENVSYEDSNMSPREWRELMDVIGRVVV